MRAEGYTAAEVRAAERPLLEAGVPLMRRAAAGLAAVLRELGPDRILLLAGSGDNGGDGLFAAAEAAAGGVPVRILTTGSRIHEEGLAAALAADAVREDRDADGVARDLRAGDVILDAMVGTGSSGPGLRGSAREVAAVLRSGLASGVRVVAVDVPSGIGVDDGALPADGVVLPADVTVTFGALKAGLLRAPASAVCGEVRLVDIGLGPYLPA